MNLRSKLKMRTFQNIICIALLCSGSLLAQDEKQKARVAKEGNRLLQDAQADLNDDAFNEAEVDLRKAIALLPEDERGKYNLGNAYYGKDLNQEAMQRYLQAAKVAQSKTEKHKAYHNLGNTLMNAKKYEEAVEAYKNALRNNPTDDETRYNLALAKEMLEKNPPQGGDGEDENQDQNQDQNQQQQNQENQDDQGKEKEGDDGENKEEESEDQGDQKDDQKQGDQQGQNEQPNEPKPGDQEEQQQQKPVPGKLSPQQVQNLLEAMNNEEKKVQDKINARKQKGAKVKSEKDW